MADGDNGAPTPPDGLPNYITDGLDRQEVDDLEEVVEYAEELIEYRRSAPSLDEVYEGDGEIIEAEEKENYTEVIKKVTCGKDCDGCPHGPYVYRVRYSTNGLNWEYMGPLHDYGDE